MSADFREFKTPILEGQTFWYRCQFLDLLGTGVALGSVQAVQVTLLDHLNVVINGRNEQSVLNTNNGVYEANGTFTLKFGPLDTLAIGPSRIQRRRLLIQLEHSTDRVYTREVWFYIRNTGGFPMAP